MRGGKRQGAGRPKTNNKTVSVRLNQIALYCLKTSDNKSESINRAIEYYFRNEYPITYKFALEENGY